MQLYQNTNYNSLLTPGQYMFSNYFPTIMKQLSPTYSISAEPVFLDHLLMNLGKTIRVVTINDSLEGTLTGVAIDYIQLTVGDFNYHIRFQHITYFIGKP
ncbi:DUF2642 domain-containing protein [Metabacillus sediminilitoris]|uniref:DUF2642 domain-containing protein n=1 Tax=Metabacillus sediminilitoris TaxID=2567941 RepID=A0A4S4BWW6_9BACI|nr:DUF2642 domain-containing protein [Metabacillus sediminilitoris]QGQ45995.1 DUF2642 domain-containing protein [Metabacillus sediminilitoris]THF79679.1 DUF2642 domain-containing protein [Metabacillus sediminilitoris]